MKIPFLRSMNFSGLKRFNRPLKKPCSNSPTHS
jgi:hypothetical protein